MSKIDFKNSSSAKLILQIEGDDLEEIQHEANNWNLHGRKGSKRQKSIPQTETETEIKNEIIECYKKTINSQQYDWRDYKLQLSIISEGKETHLVITHDNKGKDYKIEDENKLIELLDLFFKYPSRYLFMIRDISYTNIKK